MAPNWNDVYGRNKRQSEKPSWDAVYGRQSGSSKKSFLESAALGAADWGTFGLFDEAMGGLGAALDSVGLAWDGKTGDYWKEYWRNEQRKAQEDDFGAYALGGLGGSMLTGFGVGGLARGALGVGKSAVGAGELAQAASRSTLAQRALATAPAAAVGGAISGIGATNDRGDMLSNALWGGALGGISAPLIYGGGALAKNAVAKHMDNLFGVKAGPLGKAATYIEEEMALQGQTPQNLLDKIDELTPQFGPDGRQLLDAKRNPVGQKNAWIGDAMVNADGDNYGFELTKAASGKQGPALVSAKARAKARNQELGNETADMIWDKTPDVGKRQEFWEIMQSVGDEDEALSAVYNKLHGVPLPISKETAAMIQHPNALSGPMQRVSQSMLGVLPGVKEKPITVGQMLKLAQNGRFWQKTLTETRKEMEAAYQRGDPNASRIKDSYNYLRNVMGDIIGPDWTKTQEAWATNKLREEAAKFGHKAIMETDGVKLADNISQINKWDEAIEAGRKLKPLPANAGPDDVAAHQSVLRSAARARVERQAARKGMVARLEEAVSKQQTRSGVRNMLRNVGDNKQHEEVIMRLLGARRVTTGPNKGQWDQRYNIADLMDQLGKKYQMFDNVETSGIIKGPKTAEVMGGSSAIDAATDAADVTKDILSGNILGGILKTLNREQSKKFGRESAAVHNEIVRITTMPVEQAQQEIAGAGGVLGWLRGRSTVERMQRLAERRAKQPLQNAHLMADALGAGGLYSGYGAGELRDLWWSEGE